MNRFLSRIWTQSQIRVAYLIQLKKKKKKNAKNKSFMYRSVRKMEQLSVYILSIFLNYFTAGDFNCELITLQSD